ncbi:MAG: SUMF1/EgtB/PvdO family nonheme iron enzyme, partial [Bacteroidota bacterium]
MSTTLPHIQVYTEELSDRLSFPMIKIAGGSYLRGSQDEEAYEDEQPVLEVHVPDFWLGQYLVTQEIWEAVMGENPSHFQGANR